MKNIIYWNLCIYSFFVLVNCTNKDDKEYAHSEKKATAAQSQESSSSKKFNAVYNSDELMLLERRRKDIMENVPNMMKDDFDKKPQINFINEEEKELIYMGLFHRFKPERAIAILSAAIKINPNNFASYYFRGLAKATPDISSNAPKLLDTNGAIADFSKAISLNPNYAAIYVSRSDVIAGFTSNPDKAFTDLKKALEINSNYIPTYKSFGQYYKNRRDFDNALSSYNQAIKLSEPDKRLFLSRARILIALKKNDLACADLQKALKLGETTAQKVINTYCQ